MRTRNGKIARLPYGIRELLNERLERSQPSPKLLAWLNALPLVREILEEDFDGEPVSRQNLSEWRQGGFLEWLARRDLCGDACDMAQSTEIMDDEVTGVLADSAATVLAARFGCLIANWDGEVDAKFEAKTRVLNRLCRSVVQLQRGVHQANRESLEAQQIVEEREKAEKEALQEKLVGRWYDALREPALAKLFGGGTAGQKIAEYILAVKRGNVEADLDILPTDTYGNGKTFEKEAEPVKSMPKKRTRAQTRKAARNNVSKPLEEGKIAAHEAEPAQDDAKPVKVCNSDLEQLSQEGLGVRFGLGTEGPEEGHASTPLPHRN